MTRKIYFDHAATTSLDRRVFRQLKPYLFQKFGNASSLHSFGQTAAAAVTQARQQIADFFYCQPEEIYFTSGATEADNLAIKGVLDFFRTQFKVKQNFSAPHFITSAFEHPAVLESALAEERAGCQLTLIKPYSSGCVTVESIIQAIRPETVLISLMYVNNELGTIQPVVELGKRLRLINQERLHQGWPRIYFHVDAVQALNNLNCRPDHLEADLIAFSGHKISAPKGIGLLYIRNQTPLRRQSDGGHQERTLRAGTLNVPGIVGLAAAIQLLAREQTAHYQKLQHLHAQLVAGLRLIPDLHFNTDLANSLPNIINFRIAGVKAEDLHLQLDLAGVAVSTGSACASGAVKISPVLLAIGQTEAEAAGGLRLSFSWRNTAGEVKKFLKILRRITVNKNE